MEKYNVPVASPPAWEEFQESLHMYRNKTQTALIEDLEADFEVTENELRNLEKYRTQLNRDYNANVEMKHVLLKAREFFHSEVKGAETYFEGAATPTTPLASSDMEFGRKNDIAFSYITGTLEQADVSSFERLVFRSTRGNVFTRFKEIEVTVIDPVSGAGVLKSVFIIFYRSASIEAKLMRICDTFGAKRFTVPNLSDDRLISTKLRDVAADIEDAEQILKQNNGMVTHKLNGLASSMERWKHLILKEKAVYHTMNMFVAIRRNDDSISGGTVMLRGEGWVIKAKKDLLAEIISSRGTGEGGGILGKVPEKRWPVAPTYFKLNKLTASYQGLVSTYGVPRYREANPAIFACASFPFLFGVMYGDVGHATLLFLAALFMVIKEDQLKKNLGELDGMVFGGRYLLVGMGFMSIYCGFIYNDYFSLGLNIFGSRWTLPIPPALMATRIGDVDNVYPIGVDPAWHVAENSLQFTNSLKMKMAVVFGVSQMMLGFFLKLSNYIYFKKPLDIAFEALPQIVMFTALYGYSCFLIIYKWTIDWNVRMAAHQTPPDLISMLINMVLAPGTVVDPLFEGQAAFQGKILLLCLVCILLMLFPKPLIMYYQQKNKAEHGPSDLIPSHDGDDDDHDDHHGGGHDEHGDLTDVIVHIGIETIEFILGSVSNTASYLRLWALSLAHAQLAEVFLVQFFIPGINSGVIGTIIGYGVWAGATTLVLLMMDVLECLLHALRLHWVEFQNKFYKADGYEFEPMSFKILLKFPDSNSL